MRLPTHRSRSSRARVGCSLRLELLEDRLLPSVVLLYDPAPPPPPFPADNSALRSDAGEPPFLERGEGGEYGKDRSQPVLQEALEAADAPALKNDPQAAPPAEQQPSASAPGSTAAAAPLGIATATFDSGMPAAVEAATAAELSVTSLMRAAETTTVEDVQGQQDFQSRLDSFTAPPPTQLVASPQPLDEGSLAVVATLLTSAQEAPAAAGAAAPFPSVPAPLPASRGEDAGVAFLIGVQEALQRNLAAERQRLFNIAPQPDAGLLPPLAGNLPALDPRQTRADPVPATNLFTTFQLPVIASDALLLGPLAEAPAEPLVPGLVEGVPAPFPAGASSVNEEGGPPPRLHALLVAAVFAAGLSSVWWADSFPGQAGARPGRGRGRRGAAADDKR